MPFTAPTIFPRPRIVSWSGDRCVEYRGMPSIRYSVDPGLPAEGYTIDVDRDGVRVCHGGPAGAFYAGVTLRQLMCQYEGWLPRVHIEDAPDFPKRGVLLDIGRDKIPTMESLYGLIDLLAGLKINQLHLYMEGYCFEYPAHRENFPDETPITADEYRRLDAYARDRFIELVPTQNCFGHMSAWLVRNAYADLAENPEGFELIPGLRNPPSVLNPLDPRSFRLVAGLLDELLPNFTSPLVNICFDEPFELGSGKSSAACAGRGVGRVYLGFLEKVCSVVAGHGRRPMIWGDVVTKHPELLEALPRDITILDWNYEGLVSFAAHCLLLREHGLSFYVCPGTSGWCSIAGRVSNMRANLLDAAEQGLRYGACGFLITDWGDMGHWQVPAVGYPGYAYGAALAWNLAGNRDADIAGYLDTFVFEDEARLMGTTALALGDYSRYEGLYIPNATLTFGLLALIGLCGREELAAYFSNYLAAAGAAGLEPAVGGEAEGYGPGGQGFPLDFDMEGLRGLLAQTARWIDQAHMTCADAPLVADEYRNTIRLLSHGADLLAYIMREEKLTKAEKKALLRRMSDDMGSFIEYYKALWLRRNREGGLDRSTKRFFRLREQYEEKLALM